MQSAQYYRLKTPTIQALARWRTGFDTKLATLLRTHEDNEQRRRRAGMPLSISALRHSVRWQSVGPEACVCGGGARASRWRRGTARKSLPAARAHQLGKDDGSVGARPSPYCLELQAEGPSAGYPNFDRWPPIVGIAQRTSASLSGAFGQPQGHIPRQQLADPADRMSGNPFLPVPQVDLQIDPIQPRRPDQGADRGCPPAASVLAGK